MAVPRDEAGFIVPIITNSESELTNEGIAMLVRLSTARAKLAPSRQSGNCHGKCKTTNLDWNVGELRGASARLLRGTQANEQQQHGSEQPTMRRVNIGRGFHIAQMLSSEIPRYRDP